MMYLCRFVILIGDIIITNHSLVLAEMNGCQVEKVCVDNWGIQIF